MTQSALTVWAEPTKAVVPTSARKPAEIVAYGVQLTPRDQKQIVAAFKSESYEMAAGFVLKRALSTLKRQLGTLGMPFIGEMLSRTDITEDSSPSTTISDFEAITLARELGIIASPDAKRLAQHVELLAYFDEVSLDDADAAEMDRDEAKVMLRTCIQAILGKERLDAPMEFMEFRGALEGRTFKPSDHDVLALSSSPYFFRKITVSVLLSGIRSASGAQFEHILGNTLVIVPIIWESLRAPEKWSVGQAYAEAVNGGNKSAAVALKKTLSEVRGFDFVPETLRSQAFTAAASAILEAHNAYNNFYNEPPLMAALSKLGSTIPWPAFPACMSATMAVKLGNRYGVSAAAQSHADTVLNRLTANQWEYYVNNCLPFDELILQKLAWADAPRNRWKEVAAAFDLSERTVKQPDARALVEPSSSTARIKSAAERLWTNRNSGVAT